MTDTQVVDAIPARALDGVRVFELGIAIASPSIGRYMAHHGAEVFKVESPTNPDIVRLLGSAWLRDDEERVAAWADSSPYVPEMNADKKSVALNLKEPSAREAALKLVAECDVFIANYAARALVELGLDYEGVSAVRPDIVYVQLPGFGADPSMPYYPFVAWGPNQAPLVGLDALTGHADREPAGIATVAPPDYLSALHGTIAVLVGLEHRDQTGEGAHVVVPQFETTIGMLAPFVMEDALTGDTVSRIGNRSLWYAPEGVYPCIGHERWIAISADSEDAWEILRSMAAPALDDDRFSTLEGRMANQDDLDEAVGSWTNGFENTDLAARLQQAGVTAHIVATNEDMLQDEHIKRSGWYQVNPSARFTRDLYSGNPIGLSETPGVSYRGGPSTGEHTVEILTEVAGLSAEEVQSLIDDGAAFTMAEPDLVIDRPYEEWLHVLFPGQDDTRDL
ncbi:MAG: CoA transferase [Actinomycetota bacterium]|jgi:crotonobetainyl-CoA:carnitine CoA-transferase CaiB-like acyl-CoA transferase|nr:CoA transferase [Actinomycetota bacterium]